MIMQNLINQFTFADKNKTSKREAEVGVSKMRPSKSDTSISDSFVVVDSACAGQNTLRSGEFLKFYCFN